VSAGLPSELWLGKQSNEWPIHAFTSDGHLAVWLAGRNDNMAPGCSARRRAWRVRIEVIEEVELTEPVPARVVPVARH
jgi:hypothetical protein